jgi:hypothetical protein
MSRLKKHWSNSNRFSILAAIEVDEEYQPSNLDETMDLSNPDSSPSDVDMDQDSSSPASASTSSEPSFIEDIDAIRINRYNGIFVDIPQGISQSILPGKQSLSNA